MSHWISVAVQTPAHSAVGGPLTYRSELPLAPGTLVRAPLGTREVLGIVWSTADGPPDGRSADGIRAIAGVLEGITPLSTPWRELVAFAARYYQRALGELALAALPPQLRELSSTQLARRLKAIAGAEGRSTAELVRAAVAEYARRRGARPLPASVGSGRSGDGTLSERAEELLAGMGSDR